ncbi:hypothetical protein, partial [Bradyrhizobium oropedii]|uniref:hypothetical protein n=1 Tax=Bradyrhizobium oropedii TaxID=1571201 RepID=UPI001E5DD395
NHRCQLFYDAGATARFNNHRCQLFYDAGATARFNNARLWLWVPAPVRNCALGRDDSVLVARGEITSTASPEFAWAYAETPVFPANGHATVDPQCWIGPECTA